MDRHKVIGKQRRRRRFRVRKGIKGTPERPRLSVHRTLKHLYCQLIDDESGKTIAAASTRDKDLREQVKVGGNKDAAKAVGSAMARTKLMWPNVHDFVIYLFQNEVRH